MKKDKEWWHNMFDMHAILMENQDDVLLREFKKRLHTIRFEYSKPYEGLGIGSTYVKDIAGWFDDVSKWAEAKGNYVDAEKYLRIAMDFYREPLFDFDDDYFYNALYRMYDIVECCPRGTKGPWY